LARVLGGLRRRARTRAPSPYEARELRTELTIVAAFVAAATAIAVTLPRPGVSPAAVVLLCALLVVMLAVEFDVDEGRTSPVQLVFLPMLVLLPPAYVPVVVAVAHVVRALGPALLGRRPPVAVVLAVGDAWYAIGATLVVGLAAAGDPSWHLAPVFAAALAAQVTVDFVAIAIRLRIGLGTPIRPELSAMAWVYLVDVLLAPIGMLAALVGGASLGAVVLVLPLAGLLAVFARERRGRIENALALGRVAEENEQRIQALVQHASDLIAIAERDGTVRTLTGAARELLGPAWQDVPGTTLYDHAHPADHSVIAALLATAARRPRGESAEAEWRMRRPDGSWRHVEGIATNLLDEPHVEALVVTIRDVHERRAFEEELRHRAFHDQLTGLPNRALFYDRIEHALGKRNDRLLALIFIDLDDFKAVNDRLGHAAGDALLVEFAARLRNCVRSADTPARLAGDEFGVLLEDVAGPNEPVQVAERILAALGEPMMTAGAAVAVAPSIGIVVSGLEGEGPEELLRRADVAMYTAKEGGKGRWELYQPALEAPRDADGAAERASFATRTDEQREQVLSLLDRPDAVRTVFQPIIDLRTGELAAYEALSRFDSPIDQPPNVWFEQAHRCGLGYRLEALAFERALQAPGRPRGTHLTVNLSLSTLASPELRAVLPERLDGVVIEITENELVTEKADVLAAMALVRERGARLAVDDAGSGYAGLQHVMRLEPDVIKLDRALVDGVAADPVKAALIEAFVRYGRRIDATICAEGIETLEDLEVLADIDVVYGQGWAIGRPAAPWAPIAVEAAERCRARSIAALRAPASDAADPVERVADALSHVIAPSDVAAALAPVVDELRASHAVVYGRRDDALVALGDAFGPGAPDLEPIAAAAMIDGRAVQLVADGGTADPLELRELEMRGSGAMLGVPIVAEGRTIGALEIYAAEPRSWSRYDVHRTRIVSHHLRGAITRLHTSALPVTGALAVATSPV
jgi:diguanylate cyclase (GGDEF)-like protein/PAS domain S-box-containing protein